MPAMRLMSKADFHKALIKHGFAETAEKTSENTLWHHAESKRHFTIPHYMDEVPDSILDEYLQAVGRLYHLPASSAHPEPSRQDYCVTEAEPEKKKYKPEVIELKPSKPLP